MEWLMLFSLSLLPNFMRQLVYLKSFKRTGGFGFCVSPETRVMHSRKWLPWSGFLEEVVWAITWTIAWFNGFQWLMFGWVSDALLDCAIAYSWFKGKRSPKILFNGHKHSFIVREVLLPYLVIGPLLYLMGLNILLYISVSFIIGVVLWLMI